MVKTPKTFILFCIFFVCLFASDCTDIVFCYEKRATTEVALVVFLVTPVSPLVCFVWLLDLLPYLLNLLLAF